MTIHERFLKCSIGLIAVVLMGATPGPCLATPPPENLENTVAYLLSFVASSDCTFVRNGKSHTPKEASEHMKAKYEHFRNEIKTPEDFIRLAATKSILSGKKYMVQTKDGEEVECAEWLTRVLHQYRESQSAPKKG